MTEATDEVDGMRLYRGNALSVLAELPDDSIDSVITDPPYSSGGMTRGDRTQRVSAKYVSTGSARFRGCDFAGDNRDQRAWGYWCSLWLAECLRVTRPGGYCLVFADWRQLPMLTDVFQSGGWVWRGILAWDKGPSARSANTAYFRHQCEYVVWGTRGTSDGYDGPGDGPWPGCYQVPVLQADKEHVTGKPTALMAQLVRCCPVGGTVLDPFMGSGTTGVGCQKSGRKFVGVEIDEGIYETARDRLARVSGLGGLFPPEPAAEQLTFDSLTESQS